MAYEHKNNSGGLFANEKRPGKQDPDFSSVMLIHNIMTRVKVWDNGDQGPNKPRFGVKYEVIEEQAPKSFKPKVVELDDEVPF